MVIIALLRGMQDDFTSLSIIGNSSTWRHSLAEFTPTQGRYLAFLHAYTSLHGYPPSESEMAQAMCVAPPSVNTMMKMLEKKGLISRQPGQGRSVRVIIPEEEIPAWNNRKSSSGGQQNQARAVKQSNRTVESAAPPATLYVFKVYLTSGPIGPEMGTKEISRVIEIRGDQTLEELHEAIFEAYDRWEEHLYEFQLGKRPHDPKGPNYGMGAPDDDTPGGDAQTTKLDDLNLKLHRTFGYWFDFGDDWFHQVQLEKIDQAIPTVTYPRVTKKVGKAHPQYPEEAE